MTGTLAFVDWIRGTALVDSAGEPILLWRGESGGSEHTTFNRARTREAGFFFTPVRPVAEGYAARSQAARAFYVRAPRVLDLMRDTRANRQFIAAWAESFEAWTDRRSGETVDPYDCVEGGQLFDYEGDWSSERWRDLQGTADWEGYDAVILPDFDSSLGVFPSVVVFRPEIIRLASDFPDSPYGMRRFSELERAA